MLRERERETLSKYLHLHTAPMIRAMAYSFFSYLKSHPFITAFSLLLLFTLPILHMLMFFWPLILSTVLGVLAVISFGRQSDEHAPPIAACGTAESAWQQPDFIAFPSHEENISNVLMVGNQEVTWLEWLHNEGTQKLCARERAPAVWDAYGCDGSTTASGFTCMDEAVDGASLQAKDKGRLYAYGSRGEGETHVSALVSTEENEPMAVVPPSTVLGRFIGTAIVIGEEETEMMNAPILTAEEESNLDDLTGEDRTCRCGTAMENGITFINNRESNTDAPAFAEGNERLCLPRGGGNECKAMQGSLESTIHTKNEVKGYPSAGEDEVAGIVESTNECNSVTDSLESTIDIESTLNKCVLKGKTSLHVATPTLEESTAHISHTSELKTADTHEQDATDLQFSNKTMSPVVEVKGAKVHEMRHVQQDQAERGSNLFETQVPQWDVSDGEEDRSSLRFSFFHNSSLTPSEA